MKIKNIVDLLSSKYPDIEATNLFMKLNDLEDGGTSNLTLMFANRQGTIKSGFITLYISYFYISKYFFLRTSIQLAH